MVRSDQICVFPSIVNAVCAFEAFKADILSDDNAWWRRIGDSQSALKMYFMRHTHVQNKQTHK